MAVCLDALANLGDRLQGATNIDCVYYYDELEILLLQPHTKWLEYYSRLKCQEKLWRKIPQRIPR